MKRNSAENPWKW